MISWVALIIAVAFVPVGAHVRARIVRRWGEPSVLRAWWVRAVLVAAVVVLLGVPAVKGYVNLAPVYGLGLGILGPGPRPRRCAAARP